MEPKSPFTQPYARLPNKLPLYTLENALLPGGELPLELELSADLALFFYAVRTDQLIGMVQPHPYKAPGNYRVGCAGRIRQYRERKDGRLNVMLSGICRYRILDESTSDKGFTIARVDWREFKNDYLTDPVNTALIDEFKVILQHYFNRNSMQVDWKVLDERPIEEVVNNLILVLQLDIESKQQLLETPTVADRLKLFQELLGSDKNAAPVVATIAGGKRVS